MRTVRHISEAEMVALFLATEYPSPRTHQHILQVLQREGWPPRIIEEPNIHDVQENAQRRSVLGAYRGYGKTPDYFESLPPDVEYLDYFEGFPPDVRWERAMLSHQELEQVQYIECLGDRVCLVMLARRSWLETKCLGSAIKGCSRWQKPSVRGLSFRR